MIYIADNWFETYLDSIPGAYYDGNNTGLIVIPFESVPSLKPFTFYVAGMVFFPFSWSRTRLTCIVLRRPALYARC